mmetsp:Transcript_6280/g.20476  ORF Transcript_6280/g.20476 Transcript_6280/m.20476 type:complete len:122 (+) Transcript_6280:86-451(+)
MYILFSIVFCARTSRAGRQEAGGMKGEDAERKGKERREGTFFVLEYSVVPIETKRLAHRRKTVLSPAQSRSPLKQEPSLVSFSLCRSSLERKKEAPPATQRKGTYLVLPLFSAFSSSSSSS